MLNNVFCCFGNGGEKIRKRQPAGRALNPAGQRGAAQCPGCGGQLMQAARAGALCGVTGSWESGPRPRPRAVTIHEEPGQQTNKGRFQKTESKASKESRGIFQKIFKIQAKREDLKRSESG
jgi:hypothetical protein